MNAQVTSVPAGAPCEEQLELVLPLFGDAEEQAVELPPGWKRYPVTELGEHPTCGVCVQCGNASLVYEVEAEWSVFTGTESIIGESGEADMWCIDCQDHVSTGMVRCADYLMAHARACQLKKGDMLTFERKAQQQHADVEPIPHQVVTVVEEGRLEPELYPEGHAVAGLLQHPRRRPIVRGTDGEERHLSVFDTWSLV